MPLEERSLGVDGQGRGGDLSLNKRQHREAMASNTSPQRPNPRADVRSSPHDADWDHDQDEAAGRRARRLLSNSHSGVHRVGDRL
jgi:hypothetical protein